MSIEHELNELERRQLDAFEAWDRVRAFSCAVPMGHRRGLGLLPRIPVLRQVLLAVQRLRYASALADRQRDLNLIALERASRLTQLVDLRVATVERQIGEVDQRAVSARDLAAVVHRDVGKAMNEIHDRMDTTTSYVTFQSGVLQSDVFEFREKITERLVNVEDRTTGHDMRIEDLEESTRLHRGFIRRLEQLNSGRSALASTLVPNHPHPLAGDRLPLLISQVEQRIPDLRRARQVGVSIQDGVADDMIAIQSAYFGDRLGMYGTRDNAWYHIDYTDEWNRDILFENALSKLEPGGHFILISDPARTDTVADRPLSKVLGEVFEIAPTVRASVHVWRRP